MVMLAGSGLSARSLGNIDKLRNWSRRQKHPPIKRVKLVDCKRMNAG
jgi:hypothetical protein